MLTKISWDSGWLTVTGRVVASDQLPRRDTGTSAKVRPLYTQKTERLGRGERIRGNPNLEVTVLAKHLIT